MAIHAGADALGLVGKMPSGPGPIENEMISTIRKIIPPPLASFLLTSEQSAEGIINHIRSTQTNTIQIVDAVGPGTYKEIVTIFHICELCRSFTLVGRQVLTRR
jgi:phosphoribosylanthranilate isomerase